VEVRAVWSGAQDSQLLIPLGGRAGHVFSPWDLELGLVRGFLLERGFPFGGVLSMDPREFDGLSNCQKPCSEKKPGNIGPPGSTVWRVLPPLR